jgi:hypothetical protein
MNTPSEASHSEALASRTGTDHGPATRLQELLSSKLAIMVVGACIVLAYVGLGLYSIVLKDRPEAYDSAGYLLEANRIAENGGVLAFPGMIAEGKWEQANQHPLYVLAITPFAEYDFDFMISAKLVSLFFGVLAVVAGYIIAVRYFSPLIAALAVTGFVLTQQWVMWSTLVACESLLILLSILMITSIFVGFQDRRYWIVAGFLGGIAYLTKVTALLLLPGFFLAVLLRYGMRVFRIREVYLFVVAFLIACSPLLISNAIVQGTVFYNVNIDNLSDRLGGVAYHERSIERGSMIRIYNELTNGDQAGPSLEIPAEEAAGLVSNVLERLPGEFALLLETLSPWPLNTAPTGVRWLLGLVILSLFLTGVLREPNPGARNYMLLTVAVFLVALSLHRPIERYLLPIHFYIWVYAATGVVFLLYRFGQKMPVKVQDSSAVLHASSAALCALLGIFLFGTKGLLQKVPNAVEVEPHRRALVDWMRENIQEDDRYVEGPNIRWVFRNGKHIYPPHHSRISADGFVEFIRENDIKYVIAESKSMHLWRYRGRFDRRLQFEGILEFDRDAGIRELALPEDWTRVAFDEDGIVDFVVYEVMDRSG